MKKLLVSLFTCLTFVVTFIPITILASPTPTIDLGNGVSIGYIATNIDDTGKNLVETNLLRANANDIIVNSAIVQNEKIFLKGTVNDINFDISGTFCSISDNGNVLVFNATDTTQNFRVVYCSIEKDIEQSSLYFKSFAKSHPEYNVVTKLYLAPNSFDNASDNQYIMTELYGNEFPQISSETINALPADHQLNLFWYAKEFSPVSTDHNTISSRAGNPSYILLETYTFQNLGMTYRHFLRYKESCDIRDVTRNQDSSASATLEVTAKWVEAELPNDCSSTDSALSITDISIGYFTMPSTAVQRMMSTGQVTRSGSIKFDYTFKIGFNLKGISIPTTVYLSWQPGSTNYNTGIYYKAHTNAGGNYWRDAVAVIDGANSLKTIGNNVQVMWEYASYSNNTSSGTANIIFKFGVNNQLDYTKYHPVEHIIPINVNVI